MPVEMKGVEAFTFRCPFCTGEVSLGSVQANTATEPSPAIFHLEPPCEKFLKLSPADFLHAVNVKLGHYN